MFMAADYFKTVLSSTGPLSPSWRSAAGLTTHLRPSGCSRGMGGVTTDVRHHSKPRPLV